jgi:hypothetical protein
VSTEARWVVEFRTYCCPWEQAAGSSLQKVSRSVGARGPDQCPRTGRPSRPSLNSQVFVLVDMPRCRSTATGRSLHRTHLAGPRPNLITPHSHTRNCHSLCFYVWRIVFLFSRVMSSPVHTGLERLPWPNPRPSPRKLCGFRGAHKGLPHSSNMQPSFLQHKRAMGLHSESAPQGC